MSISQVPAVDASGESGTVVAKSPLPATIALSSLLGQASEIRIAHGEALYTLRLTRQGKLILTK